MLKNKSNLNDDYGEKERLEEALNINKALAAAYYLKEALKLFWLQKDKTEAKKFLGQWIAMAKASRVRLIVNWSG